MSAYSAVSTEELPEDLARLFQSFYASLEDDLITGGSPSLIRRREERHNEDDREKARREQEKVENEGRNKEILEKVERTLSSVFYDR